LESCIGFDLHGVLTERPDISREFLKCLRDVGIEVHIMSGSPLEDLRIELDDYGYEEGIHYDALFSVVSYLKDHHIPMWQDENGNWWAHDDDWWPSKGKYCVDNSIIALFDDSRRYEPYLPEYTTFHHITGLRNSTIMNLHNSPF